MIVQLDQLLNKNGAADYLSKRLRKEVSGEAVRKLHVRGVCPAFKKSVSGRLLWDRKTLDGYVKLYESRAREAA